MVEMSTKTMVSKAGPHGPQLTSTKQLLVEDEGSFRDMSSDSEVRPWKEDYSFEI